jgi:hypothetical protein
MNTITNPTPETKSNVRIYFAVCEGIERAQQTLDGLSQDKLQEAVHELVENVRCTHMPRHATDARQKLVASFGEEILQTPMVKDGDKLFFTLSESGKQFRCWYGPFGRVEDDHFDSCGSHCAFTVSCQDPKVLYHWVKPIVGDRIRWKSENRSKKGYVWMGWPGPFE